MIFKPCKFKKKKKHFPFTNYTVGKRIYFFSLMNVSCFSRTKINVNIQKSLLMVFQEPKFVYNSPCLHYL